MPTDPVLLAIVTHFVLQQPLAAPAAPLLLELPLGGKPMSVTSADFSEPTKAVRLIFEYDGDQVRLVSQQPVEVALTDADLVQTDRPGFFVDVRDSGGQTLARAAAQNAFSGSLEVFPEQPGEPFRRIDVDRPKGAFTVVVPTPAAADHVTVLQITPDQTGVQQPGGVPGPSAAQVKATDLASFPLSQKP
jgi:hypothetical protein